MGGAVPNSAAGLLCLAAFLLAGTPNVSAGSISGSIHGSVSDPNGAAIPGVAITVMNVETGRVCQTATGVDGTFVAAALPEGRYALAVSVAGAEPVVLEPLEISGGRPATQVAASSPFALVKVTVSSNKGNPRQALPPEGSEEFRIEQGRAAGATLNPTRAGAGKLRGALMYARNGNNFDALTLMQERIFEGLRQSGLSGADALRRAPQAPVDNRALVSAGFPVWPGKIFSFTSWDRDWSSGTWQPPPIPAISPEGMQNLRAAQGEFAPGALDFLTGAFPPANDPTPRGGLILTTPSGRQIAVPLAQFNRAASGGVPYDRGYWTVLERVDTRVTGRNSRGLRALTDRIGDPGLPASIPGQEIGEEARNRSVVLNDSHIFSAVMRNELRFAHGRLAAWSRSNPGTALSVGGFNSIGNPNSPERRNDNSHELMDNLGFALGGHSMNIGFNILHYQIDASFVPNAQGTLTFGSLADLLMDRDAVFTRFTGAGLISARSLEAAGYFQDDWKVKPRLTLSLGARYEVSDVPLGFLEEAGRDRNRWQPRFGLAWNPGAGGRLLERTVFRGGYAMVSDPVDNRVLISLAQNFPRGAATVIGPVSGLVFGPRPAGAAPAQFGGNPNLSPAIRFATDSSNRVEVPYHQHYALGLDRRFGSFVFRAFYVGSRGAKLLRLREANPGFTAEEVNANPALVGALGLRPVMDPAGLVSGFRPDPSRGSVLLIEPTGQSSYNSGQFSLERRSSAGIRFDVRYTYGSFTSDSFADLSGNPWNLMADRARLACDQPHRVVANYAFTIPRRYAYRHLTRIVSGWEISGATTAASGMPYGVLNAANALGILPALGVAIFGTERARNTERLPWIQSTDLAVAKSIKTFTEHQALQLRAEFYNVFNHRNYTAVPFNILGAGDDPFRFQNFRQTEAMGRAFTFAARYSF